MVPGSLGFIKDDDAIAGRTVVLETGISKVVNVLDERLHLLSDVRSFLPLGLIAKAFDGIPNESFTKDRNQRAVSREKDCVCIQVLLVLLRGHVKADESLAGTGNSRDKHDGLGPCVSGFLDQLVDPL
jgi:hypothetical protein